MGQDHPHDFYHTIRVLITLALVLMSITATAMPPWLEAGPYTYGLWRWCGPQNATTIISGAMVEQCSDREFGDSTSKSFIFYLQMMSNINLSLRLQGGVSSPHFISVCLCFLHLGLYFNRL